MTHRCADLDCDYCQNRAEEAADRDAGRTDWQVGTDRYERYLDSMGPQT